jgi:hypothetical protein
MKKVFSKTEIAEALKVLQSAPLEVQKEAKKSLTGSISVEADAVKKAEAKQEKKLGSINEQVYKFAKGLCEDAKIDTKNCVTFNFRVDLGGTKFKDLTKPKKKLRTAYLKKETKKDIEMQGKDTAKMKGAKAKDLRGKREFAK